MPFSPSTRACAATVAAALLAALPARADDADGGGLSFEDGRSLLNSYSVIGGVFVEGGDGACP